MASRRTGLIDDAVDLSAEMPWWASAGLAVLSFVVLRAVALDWVPVGRLIQSPAPRALVVGLATAGQWVLPALLLIGTAIGATGRLRRRQRIDEVVSSGERAALFNMTWFQFEQLVADYFRRRGFTVLERRGEGPDGGVDIELRRESDRYLVQCKQWRSRRVGVETVRELYGVMAASQVVGGYVVTAGHFSKDAREFAHGREVHLIDGDQLLRELLDHADSSPPCPNCGASMVKRQAKVGVHAGRPFWGCPRFPACTGTRQIESTS